MTTDVCTVRLARWARIDGIICRMMSVGCRVVSIAATVRIHAGMSAFDLRCRVDEIFLGNTAADPLTRALGVLAGRARETQTTAPGFILDGRPADARAVIRAANHVVRMFGGKLIPYPDCAPPEPRSTIVGGAL